MTLPTDCLLLEGNKIQLPNEALIDILSFFPRRLLNVRMRFVSRQFLHICNENVRAVHTFSDLIVDTSLKYGWEKRLRRALDIYCCIPPQPLRLNRPTTVFRNRVRDMQTTFKMQTKGSAWMEGKFLTPEEFYKFTTDSQYIRFSNVIFLNIQWDYIIDFFKHMAETTEIFSRSCFHVRFEHIVESLRLKSGILFVPRNFNDRYYQKEREIALDDFVSGGHMNDIQQIWNISADPAEQDHQFNAIVSMFQSESHSG
ncbi:hypothetical protein Ddc_14997 [Ditylenchus destructor]|nr:hypothetical protein Ddc_14997 [Ditylenchus destructor]